MAIGPYKPVKLKLTGFNQQVKALEGMARAAGDPNISGNRLAGEHIMLDVKASRPGEGVPVLTGALRSTGRVTGPDPRGVVRLTFGGTAAPYALVQHERLDLNHKVGEARYLVRGAERFAAGKGPQDALKAQAAAITALGARIGGGKKGASLKQIKGLRG